MPLFLCRWPNGDFSMVLAKDKNSAIRKLDEVANADGCPMTVLNQFMGHFRLTDTGSIELESLGELTDQILHEVCYPILDKVRGDLVEANVAPDQPEYQAKMAEAVKQERERIEDTDGPEPQTERGKELQKMSDMPASLIDAMLKDVATETLKKYKKRRGRKPS